MSDAVYARNAARPRPRARRALVELETLNSARLPVVSCFCVPARARPLSCALGSVCVGLGLGFDCSLRSRVVVPLPVPAPVRGLCRGYSTLSILHVLDLTPLYLGLSVLIKTTCPMGGG